MCWSEHRKEMRFHLKDVPDYSVAEIRPIAQQSLVALKALKSMGLVHADIKPNNLMFVNPGLYPFKVKPIDFGLARKISDLKSTSHIQSS